MPALHIVCFSPLIRKETETSTVLYYKRDGLGSLQLLYIDDETVTRGLDERQQDTYRKELFGGVVGRLTDHWARYQTVPERVKVKAGKRDLVNWSGYVVRLD